MQFIVMIDDAEVASAVLAYKNYRHLYIEPDPAAVVEEQLEENGFPSAEVRLIHEP